jgi:hypothetical protein
MAYTKRSDAELLQAALFGYQHQYTILGERMAEITRELGGRAGRPDAASATQPKGVRSAETRSRMAAAQRKRWAERKATTGTQAKKAPRRAKRKMSAEGRANIAEATRKRWEAYRAAKAK